MTDQQVLFLSPVEEVASTQFYWIRREVIFSSDKKEIKFHALPRGGVQQLGEWCETICWFVKGYNL